MFSNEYNLHHETALCVECAQCEIGTHKLVYFYTLSFLVIYLAVAISSGGRFCVLTQTTHEPFLCLFIGSKIDQFCK